MPVPCYYKAPATHIHRGKFAREAQVHGALMIENKKNHFCAAKNIKKIHALTLYKVDRRRG